jgi:hypothetical protein
MRSRKAAKQQRDASCRDPTGEALLDMIFSVSERRCPCCHAVLRACTCLVTAATVALVPSQHHAGPAHPRTVVASADSTSAFVPGPGKLGVDNVVPGDEQFNDHREFDANPVPAAEYGAVGGSANAASFTSVPGKAVPGMITPGAP